MAQPPAPIPVEVGLRLNQLVEIDQKRENFTAVISLKARWKDPALAFEPVNGNTSLMLDKKGLRDLAVKKGTRFPAALISNQQGRLNTQNSLIILAADGEVNYFERASMVLQAPNFNFKRFPFDNQLFEIHLDSLNPESHFVFRELEGFTSIGNKLGEEEWVITDHFTRITTSTEMTGQPSARFTLAFHASRHVVYYVMKIFIPVTLIIIVSWFTFFLKDYGKRIDMAGANLLLFIAFNFTIAGELPKLGYITFLDAFLASTFAITSVVVLINVLLRRMQNHGRGEAAEIIDRYSIWVYPLLYLVAVALISLIVFPNT